LIFPQKSVLRKNKVFYVFMYKFDVISVLSYVNNFSGNPGRLAKFQQLHHLQGKQKIKAFSSSKEKIKQTA